MHRILNKQHDHIKLDLSDVNKHFTSLTYRLTRTINERYNFTEFFQNISDDVNADRFKIKHTNYIEVRAVPLGTKEQLFYGHDNIPIRYLKPAILLDYSKAFDTISQSNVIGKALQVKFFYASFKTNS